MVASQDKDTLKESQETMADFMTKEMMEGCYNAPGVKCGLIGEIGCSWPMHGKKYSVVN